MFFDKERIDHRPSRWPETIKAERQMQLDFCQEYACQISKLIKARLPEVSLTSNQLVYLVMIFYGIYFYDHICGGRILSGETTDNKNADEYRQRHRLPKMPSNRRSIRNDVAYWPVNFLDQGRVPFVDSQDSMIAIPTSCLRTNDPSEVHSYAYINPAHQNQFKCRGNFLSLPVLEYGIRCGLEEAQHSDFWHLERSHYRNDARSIDEVNGPLKGYLEKTAIKRGNFPDEMLLYYSGVGPEFAAHVVISEYYRRYFPYSWENGWREYHEVVMTHRRHLTSTRQPLSK